MNCYKEISKMLGVEPGEEFKIQRLLRKCWKKPAKSWKL